MEVLTSVATGLVGTLVGAAIAWLAARKSHRLEISFEMHREFHSPEMIDWMERHTETDQREQWRERAERMEDPDEPRSASPDDSEYCPTEPRQDG